MREPTIIGIDPGRVTGIAVHQGAGSNITGAYLLHGMPWHAILDAFLPAHVFIEQPVGSNERTLLLWERVKSLVSELRPFDRKRQLIPPRVWRAEILDNGDATKKDAIDYAVQHYPSLDGRRPPSDLAEAICIMEYGRRVVTGSLRRGKPPLPVSFVPDCDLTPAVRRGKGTGKRGRPSSNAFRLGRAQPDDPEEPPTDLYDHCPPLRGRWRILAEEGGSWLHTIMRTWVSGYVFVGDHAAYRPKPVTWRAWAADAHVAQGNLKPAVAALVDAGLVQRQGSALLFVPVEDDLTRPFVYLFRSHAKRNGTADNSDHLLKRWDGEKREPSIPPSDWSGVFARERRERLYPLTCDMCGSRNVPPWSNPDAALCVDHCDDDPNDPANGEVYQGEFVR